MPDPSADSLRPGSDGDSPGFELSLAGVQSVDLRAHNFDESKEADEASSGSARKTRLKSASIEEILEDLKATPSIQNQFSTTSLTPIGSGGMGVVIAAFDPTLDRFQAIKVLTGSPTPEATERFRGEARVIAALNNPNLVKIYSYEVSKGGRPYFVMDFVKSALDSDEGAAQQVKGAATLEKEIEEYFKVAVSDPTKVDWRSRNNQLIRYFLEALQAVSYLHDQNVIHHDLKPANILISSEQVSSTGGSSKNQRRVFVTDFGLSSGGTLSDSDPSKTTWGQDGIGNTSGFKGTLRYAAPEQLPNSGPVTQMTDIYQLGLILRHLLLNEAPFANRAIGSPGELFELIRVSEGPVSLYGDPLKDNPALPLELVAIMHKALSKDPLQRYANARELRDDLEAFLEGRSVRAFAQGLSTLGNLRYEAWNTAVATSRWVRGNQLLTSAVTAVSIGGVSSGLWLLSEQNRAAEARIAALQVEEATKRLEGEIRHARERAAEVLNAARKMASAGKLDAAVALVQPEILVALGRYADQDTNLKEAYETLRREHLERRMLLDMKSLELEGYAAAVSGLSPAVLGEFDRDSLLKARACFLPEGLTEQGIAKFAEMMRESHYSQQQRMEIADTLTKLSLCLLMLDNPPHPWHRSIPEEVRRQLVLECERIEQVCLACEIKTDTRSEIYAVPNCIRQTGYFIRRSFEPSVPLPTFETGYFRCDLTMAVLYRLPRGTQPINDQERLITDRLAEQSLRGNPEGFLDALLLASIREQSPSSSPLERYKQSYSALEALIKAYNNGTRNVQGKIDHRDLAIQIAILANRMAKQYHAFPMKLRDDPRPLAIEVSELLTNNECVSESSQAKMALEFSRLIQGVGSSSIAETAKELRKSDAPNFDVLLLNAWNQLNMNEGVSPEIAEPLFQEKLELNAPILAASIRVSQGRHDDALAILVAAAKRDSNWLADIKAYISKGELAPLQRTHSEGLRSLLSPADPTANR